LEIFFFILLHSAFILPPVAYQVIARKYRPQRFADVVGQEHVTQTLANAISQKRIAHAYLFCGPRGTGKTTIARIFAKCLNCTDGPKVEFDESDPRCSEITEGRAMDVLEIDGASNNGVEQVRELRETVKYAPASSKFKIYIIDEVHMLSVAAFNALLKTLEEPPEHVKFMFATTDPEKVLPTILSRCQRFDLRRIPVSLITEHLSLIAGKENIEIEPDALLAIARGADGGMRDAESALDQLISFCGTKIVENDVLSMFGLTARSQVAALAGSLLRGDAEAALNELNALSKHGKDLGRLLGDLLGHFRNLLIYAVSKGDTKLLEVSENEAASLKEQSSLATEESLTRVMEVFTDAEGRLRDSASKKIFVEVTLLKAIQARNAVSLDAVLNQLQTLRDSSGSGGGASPAKAAPAAPAPAPIPAAAPIRKEAPPAPPAPVAAPAPVKAAAEAVTDLKALWVSLLEAVGRAKPLLRGTLIQAHPVSLEKGVFIIGFDPEFADQMDMANHSSTHTLLQTKLAELGHHGTQVKLIKAEAPPGWSPVADLAAAPAAELPTAAPTAASAPRAGAPAVSSAPKKKVPLPQKLNVEDFKNDPLIMKALEIFKGQIIEVRA
jgi:DNA polymerase III subunit gamma/tau